MFNSINKTTPLLVLLFGIHSMVRSQQAAPISKKTYEVVLISDDMIPHVDGRLDDNAWDTHKWEANFIQHEPEENTAPSEQTAFKIFYNSKFLYIGIKCFESQPEEINNWMSRRDGFEGDQVEVIIDSFHDLRSAFSFTVSAAGVKGDKIISENGTEEDITWNPIWYAKSAITGDSWTAEMKIPLSQLRFGKSPSQVWGLQVTRKLFKNNEISVWQRIPLDASGWVSEFGELHGLHNLKSQKQLEIQPFIVSSLESFEKDSNNPYGDSNITSVNAGIDGKIGVTNDLTIDFTFNPDFGQVEADPAAIALDGFQLFFREQRPFFVENKNIFSYQFSEPTVGGSFSSDNLFYSRRIGRAPQGSANTSTDEYAESAERTTILGAVKFSGKTKEGLSIGVMETVTSNEYAKISNNEIERRELIEPLTNYFVGRVQKDFNNRNTFIGGIITSTIRNLDDNVNHLHKSAFTSGLDIKHQWKDRTWYAVANLVMSRVEGSNESILSTQTSIPHLLQRADTDHVQLDSTKTSLTGTGGDLRFGKAGKGHIKFETGVTWRSPELELNDIGFMREADDIQNYAGFSYNSLRPFSVFRKASVVYQHWFKWDFGGNLNYVDWDIQVTGTFMNNWNMTLGYFSQPHTYGKSLLQGGPRIFLADQHGAWWALGTDQRKRVSMSFDGWAKTGNSDGYFLFSNGVTLSYKPLNQLGLSLAPRYTIIRNRLQYNQSIEYNNDTRYIMSGLDQTTFSVAFRVNYAINANLSIQYYAQPFITTGKYDDFNHLDNALATSLNEQVSFYDLSQITHDDSNNTYAIDATGDGVSNYSFNNPDFSFAQYRSNFVVRYEYKPGSEIFLVWSQGATNHGSPSSSLFRSLDRQIFNNQLDNTFLIKATYRFY